MRISRSRLLFAFSALFTSTLVAQTSAPTLNTVLPQDKSVALSYSTFPGALSYNVYWSTTSNFTTLTSLSHQNTAGSAYTTPPVLTDGTQYFFAVTAVTVSGESAASNVMSATPVAQQAQQAPVAQPGDVKQQSSGSTPAQPTTNVGQSQNTNIQTPSMTYAAFTPTIYPILGSSAGLPNGKIAYDAAGVESLVNAACPTAFNPASGLAATFNDGDTYVIIHVLNLAGSAEAQNVKSSNWYIYSKHKTFGSGFAGGWKLTDFDGATRLYGAKRILLLSILENNLNAGAPEISYTLTVTKQQATNISDALQLLGLVFPQAKAAGLNTVGPASYWACSAVPVAYKTSAVKIDFAYSSGGGSPYSASQSFVNEAKEHWDFSFAFPVKKASAVQYSSTGGTVTASQINKSDLFAVFDWYPYPVDLKNSKFTLIPDVFAGVAMDSQPLHSLIFGASVGAKLVQVYSGALLIKQQQLNGLPTGSSATGAQVTSATTYGYKVSFSIGIKVSISAAAAALSGSK